MPLGSNAMMRWVRSALLSSVIVCVAGLAHADGGGHRASPWLLAALGVCGTPALHLASRRQWRFAPLLAVIALSQVGLHAAMSMSMVSGHSHDLHVTPTGGGSDATFLRMALAHAVGSVALAGLFTWLDALLWWVLRRFVVPVPATWVPLTRPRPRADVRRPRQLWMTQTLRNRGPPAHEFVVLV